MTATISQIFAVFIRLTARCATSSTSCARLTGVGCASSRSWSSTTLPTSMPGSSDRGHPRQARAGATFMSGAIRPISMPARASSSRISSRLTGVGIPVAKAYFWHRFYSHQPDLNFDSPLVRRSVKHMLDFWAGMGVDGFRLDAIPYLYEREGTSCENLPRPTCF